MTICASWDYYEATLTGIFDPASVVLALDGARVAVAGSAHRNYPASFTWDLPSGGSVQVWYGANLEVHVVLTSGACDSLVDVLRRLWPHRVSRADIAIDLDYPDAFEGLHKALHGIARAQVPNPVQSSTAGDWLDRVNGRTLYLGARSSRCLIRVYEKGHEQAAAHPDQGPFSLDWVRVEWQVRPHSTHKAAASSLSPGEVASSTRFGSQVLAHLAGVGHDSQPLRRVPSTDPLYWMIRQYRPALLALDPAMTVAQLLAREGAGLGSSDKVGQAPVPAEPGRSQERSSFPHAFENSRA